MARVDFDFGDDGAEYDPRHRASVIGRDSDMLELALRTQPQAHLGRGRSAAVFAMTDGDRSIAARKIFIGSTLAGIVHLVFYGADNPYVWDRDAVREAHCRRIVLKHLVDWWLPTKLRVAQSHGVIWNEQHQVNELIMEFIDGRGAALRQPFSSAAEDELPDLIGNVMKPLQGHLIDAGFDGAAWQAGYYNPVATSNFLLETRADGTAGWVWVDIESGVPALFPANPIGLIRYYLPRSVKYGRALFDDVDIARLRTYLDGREGAIRRDLGDEAWETVRAATEDLARCRAGWKTMGRIERSIEARLCRRRITRQQADWYRRRPLRWIAREGVRAGQSALRSLRRRIATWLHPARLARAMVEVVRLIGSESRRAKLARGYMGRVIDTWSARRQLSEQQRNQLLDQLRATESSVYLADFGMHLALKPAVKLIAWGVLPVLFGLGLINEFVLAAGVVSGGAIARTAYTAIRIVGNLVKRSAPPWVALLVGGLPIVGNAAFPAQVLFDGAGRGVEIAKFVIYHAATRLGQLTPIFGGADTLIEHRCNRLADLLLSRNRTA